MSNPYTAWLLPNKIHILATVMPPIIALDVKNTRGKRFHTRKFAQVHIVHTLLILIQASVCIVYGFQVPDESKSFVVWNIFNRDIFHLEGLVLLLAPKAIGRQSHQNRS